MRPWLRRALLPALIALSAEGGTIRGSVRAEGKSGAEGAAAGGRYESRRLKFAPRVDYAHMRDFVVYVEGAVPGSTNVPGNRQVVIQRDAVFTPHVMPVLVGTTVEWPNADEIFHNVFSFSETQPFDLGLYKDEVKRVTFNKPGRVDVFCSIHANMNCIVLVLENPFFASADDRGQYRIEGVPPGTYQVKAWHERLPPKVKEITVPADGDVAVDFVLGISGLPEY